MDDEEDEEDEADDFADGLSLLQCICVTDRGVVAGFIDERPDDEAVAQDDGTHRRFDRAAGRTEQESVEQIVQRIKERHGRGGARYNADSDQVPQRLLMPGVNDPSLWCVRVKVSDVHQPDSNEAYGRSLVENNISALPSFAKSSNYATRQIPSTLYPSSTAIRSTA